MDTGKSGNTVDRKQLAKRYEKIKLTVNVAEGIISFILLLLFVLLGYSKKLEEHVYTHTSDPYLALLLYILVIGVVSAVISFPVDYFFGFRLEHKFGLSNQTFLNWLKEGMKGVLVAVLLGVPILLIFYFILRNYELWWLWVGIVMLLYSVLLAKLAPIIIFPLFYKFKPLENEEIKDKIIRLCDRIGFRLEGVYQFDMSKNTKKANAAFTGIGKTKRIIIGDTLISGFTPDEIEMVFAHELGHYKKGHIRKNIIISIFTTIAGLFIISVIYNWLYVWLGFAFRWELGALPILAVISTIIGFLTKPLGSWLSRRFEYEADRFALETTGNFDVFRSTMEKLAFQNLANEEPSKFVETWFYSHPSIKNRIAAAQRISSSFDHPGL